jgi:hypothetical protein
VVGSVLPAAVDPLGEDGVAVEDEEGEGSSVVIVRGGGLGC